MTPKDERYPSEFLDTVKGKIKNPDTKRMVLFRSLPKEKQRQLYEAWAAKNKAEPKKPQEDDLALRTVTENGIEFATAKPVEFPFLRNTERAPRPSAGDPFEQKLEPAGFYILHKDTSGDPPSGWVTGTVKFEKPLVLAVNENEGETYGEGSWKRQLEKKYGRHGKALTKALRADGYDGIVTVRTRRGETSTSEIVALDPEKAVTKSARRVASLWLRRRWKHT